MSEKENDFGQMLAGIVSDINQEAQERAKLVTVESESESVEELSDDDYIYVIESKTPNAVQKDWEIPSEFPLCPQGELDDPIDAYFKNLKSGEVFVHNDVYESKIIKFAMCDNGKAIIVMTDGSGMKPRALAKITYQDNVFIHESLGTFFDGAEKYFIIEQGKEWTGGDVFDNYC